MKKHNFTAIGAAVALSFSSAVLAGDYWFEGGLSYIDFDGEVDLFGADATFYFEQVNTRLGPLGEASFLSRASNIGLYYDTDKDRDFDEIGGALELYIDDFYLSGGASRFSNGFDIDTYSVSAGWMVLENTRVTVGYDRVDDDRAPRKADIFTLAVKHYQPLAGETGLNLEGALGAARRGSNDVAYAFRADYYVNREFSFGGHIAGIKSDYDIGAQARWFFLPRFSGELAYTRDTEFKTNTWGVRLAARF